MTAGFLGADLDGRNVLKASSYVPAQNVPG